ncbi:MAG: IS3 family transposase [Bacteroidales bacterium]
MKATRQHHSATFKAKVEIEALQERETLSELATKYGVHPNQITRWKKEFLEWAPELFERKRNEKEEGPDIEKLYAKIGQLEMERDFVKKKLKETGPMSDRIQLVDRQEVLSIRRQCELVSVNRSSFYYKPLEESEEALKIMRLMDEHYLFHPTEGVLGMKDFLFTLGMIVNHKRVRRLLRLMGLMAIYPKKNLSKLGLAKYIRPYLLKGLKVERSNQVWAIDITYIPMEKGFLYLTAIIDVYSRYVVGWSISNTLDASCSLEVLKEAIRQHGKPGENCEFDWRDIRLTIGGVDRKLYMTVFMIRVPLRMNYDNMHVAITEFVGPHDKKLTGSTFTIGELMAEERDLLLPYPGRMECFILQQARIDKYATFVLGTNHYSVPDYLVEQTVDVKVFANQLKAYSQGEPLCTHPRDYGSGQWVITLDHYLRTLERKPGALHG